MSDIKNKIETLKKLNNAKTDKELALKLGVSVHTIGTWKQRKTLPKNFELQLIQNELVSHSSTSTTPQPTYQIEKLNIKASAGHGIENFEVEVLDKVEVSKSFFKTPIKPENLKIIEVVGDSMDPTIKDGGFVVIDTAQTKAIDDIYAILFNDAIYIKRLQFNIDGTIEIISDNKNYKTQIYEKNSQIFFKILGRRVLVIQ